MGTVLGGERVLCLKEGCLWMRVQTPRSISQADLGEAGSLSALLLSDVEDEVRLTSVE
jgi:hypothetical protein